MADRDRYAGLVAHLFETRFPPAQSAWVEGFLTLLVELRRVFGNDLDKVMILSAIGQQLLRDPALPAVSHAEAQAASLKTWSSRSTNVDALARATGIPRESVRRKVNELIADGLVVKEDGARLTVAPGAAARLVASTDVTIAMLDQLFATYLSTLAADGTITIARLFPAGAGRGEEEDPQ